MCVLTSAKELVKSAEGQSAEGHSATAELIGFLSHVRSLIDCIDTLLVSLDGGGVALTFDLDKYKVFAKTFGMPSAIEGDAESLVAHLQRIRRIGIAMGEDFLVTGLPALLQSIHAVDQTAIETRVGKEFAVAVQETFVEVADLSELTNRRSELRTLYTHCKHFKVPGPSLAHVATKLTNIEVYIHLRDLFAAGHNAAHSKDMDALVDNLAALETVVSVMMLDAALEGLPDAVREKFNVFLGGRHHFVRDLFKKKTEKAGDANEDTKQSSRGITLRLQRCIGYMAS